MRLSLSKEFRLSSLFLDFWFGAFSLHLGYHFWLFLLFWRSGSNRFLAFLYSHLIHVRSWTDFLRDYTNSILQFGTNHPDHRSLFFAHCFLHSGLGRKTEQLNRYNLTHQFKLSSLSCYRINLASTGFIQRGIVQSLY